MVIDFGGDTAGTFSGNAAKAVSDKQFRIFYIVSQSVVGDKVHKTAM